MSGGVTITTSWDDGHQLDLRVAELLTKYRLHGTFYIPKAAENGTMKTAQIRELSRAFEIGEFEMVVETEKAVPAGTVVVVNTAKAGFVGRASVQRWEPKGFDYRISLRMLDSRAREL